MAMASRGRAELVRQWKDRETSPEATKVRTEPKPGITERKVPVVYYLSRNGQLEHPHFMEVSLSSSDGLYLRDVINRLDVLRGKGMASMYSWSSKRSYKNGFVWHDICEDDFIYPAHGHEYILKGSELLHPANSSPMSQDTVASSSGSEKPLEIAKSVHYDSDYSLVRRNKKPWSSLDLNEYKVYKSELTSETALKAADAATQTDEKKQRRHAVVGRDDNRADEENPTTELGRDEISPPPSSSSPETLESLMKADGRLVPDASGYQERTVDSYPSGRFRASAVLMHLISCGSIPIKDRGFSLVSHYGGRLPRGRSDMSAKVEVDGLIVNVHPSFAAIQLEDKEYFSGSLIETKKKESDDVAEFPGLKRSSSYNADRSSKVEVVEKEIDEGVRAKCIPRKPRATTRKEANPPISRSTHGSKRINDEPSQFEQ
ncbi:protein SOSEKI 5 [Elaeis guineensis]|uniref:Protein UPSTREAM OF FLC n=1 Tax=Elaeis guineensis var. tenera TaxID=51953 RepID=A0A6I9R4Y3_ELAGV|nr:protein UPSTREAM OF FLC [Elaeis guineensis]